MQSLRAKWQEFIAVMDASADAQLAIVAALVLPTFVVIVGTLALSAVDPSTPLASTIEAAGGKLYLGLLTLAVLIFWRLGTLAACVYQRDRKRLLGS